jgi:rare lipoprotein A (peptidoglycan hydrolase)
MRRIAGALVALLLASATAQAGGWTSVHKYVKRSGKCIGQEVLASYYWTGKRTATGEAFDANGNTAAARTWPLGTRLTITNPKNGRTLTVRVNDKGPWGIAFRKGARLDLARGAARRIGMHASQYICVTQGSVREADALARDHGARQD